MKSKWCANVKFDERGSLIPININELPIEFGQIKRVMIIHGKKGIDRGKHAHFETQQMLICTDGIVKMRTTFDGENWNEVVLSVGDVLYHPNHEWLEMTFITDGTIVSLCSEEHQEKDYIKTMQYFQTLAKNEWNKGKTDAQEEQNIR